MTFPSISLFVIHGRLTLSDSKSLVQSEVAVVLAAVAPVVNPVVTFAKNVQCATACSTSQLQADVATLASDAAAIKAIIV